MSSQFDDESCSLTVFNAVICTWYKMYHSFKQCVLFTHSLTVFISSKFHDESCPQIVSNTVICHIWYKMYHSFKQGVRSHVLWRFSCLLSSTMTAVHCIVRGLPCEFNHCLCPSVSWYGVPVGPYVTLRGWRGVQIQETSLTCLHLFLSDFCDESCQLASYKRFLVRCVLACANKVITRTLLLFHFINFPCGASRKLRSESV